MPRLNGARGVALLAAAAYCWARAIAYLPITDTPSELPAGLQLISSVIPLEVWAAAWLLVGVFAAVYAFRRPDYLAWGLVVGMMSAWAIGYVLGWFSSFGSPAGISREWLNASTYGLPAVMLGLLSSRLVEPIRKADTGGGS